MVGADSGAVPEKGDQGVGMIEDVDGDPMSPCPEGPRVSARDLTSRRGSVKGYVV